MNRDALQQVVEYIEEHPDELDMTIWAPIRQYYDEPCGTTCCIAGHTLLLNGYTPDGEGGFFNPVNPDDTVKVGFEAAEILGLRYGQLPQLFHADIEHASEVRSLVDMMLIADGQEPLPVKETSDG